MMNDQVRAKEELIFWITFRSGFRVLKMTDTADGSLNSTRSGPYLTTGPYFFPKSTAISEKFSLFQYLLISQKFVNLAAKGPGICLKFQY